MTGETTDIPGYGDIEAAHLRIGKLVHRTQVFTSRSVNRIAGCEIYFKCENLQKAGAFKFRGAMNAVMLLDDSLAENGVATHSSGNHAAALAMAAGIRGISAHIVMPETAPVIKKAAVNSYGARVTFCEPTLEAREETLAEVVAETGATFIHPYNNFNVICGQGTAAKELAEDFGPFDIVMAPVGGGGLLSGTAIVVKSVSPSAMVIGGEPLNADDACRSFKSGILQPALKPNTVADGLLTSLSPLTFTIIRRFADDILCAGEETIIRAMRIIWERMKLVTEPSAAVTLAAVLENPGRFEGKKVGIILSGGNVDLERLPF